jgi:general secretion pathway protein K
MLTVTLVATLATAALWQQWRDVEIEAAERSRIQLAWVLQGALDWARLILREDARTSEVDHLSEPWAVPLAEARLSSFLAVDANNTDDAMDSFLSGQITDQQGLLNVANLVVDGKRSEVGFKAFQRLFALLQLPLGELEQLTARLVEATGTAGNTGATGLASTVIRAIPATNSAGTDNAGTLTGSRPLAPERLDQLLWLGLSPMTLRTLRPYVTLLPVPTALNLNTAPDVVIYAAVPGLELGQAQQMVGRRQQSHFKTPADAWKAANLTVEPTDALAFSVASRYFLVRGRLRLGDQVVQEASLVERRGTDVSVLWRQREASPDAAQNVTASLQ